MARVHFDMKRAFALWIFWFLEELRDFDENLCFFWSLAIFLEFSF